MGALGKKEGPTEAETLQASTHRPGPQPLRTQAQLVWAGLAQRTWLDSSWLINQPGTRLPPEIRCLSDTCRM
ncbi:hypothetical protein J4Q44_G00105460 [Coregonus suidteri]|uniref:Uncharacterized protein n=1 Tax=Coregonus suidteri TaxID=861788 RepID=A0AAN8LVJ4_9TELE